MPPAAAAAPALLPAAAAAADDDDVPGTAAGPFGGLGTAPVVGLVDCSGGVIVVDWGLGRGLQYTVGDLALLGAV